MNYVAIAGQNIGLERHLLDTRGRLPICTPPPRRA
jgi:hypothetical protein